MKASFTEKALTFVRGVLRRQFVARGMVLLVFTTAQAVAFDPRSDLQISPYSLGTRQSPEYDQAITNYTTVQCSQAYYFARGHVFTYDQLANWACAEVGSPIYTGGWNQWLHFRDVQNSISSQVLGIATPNADTVYSGSALDLSAEPIVVRVPQGYALDDRYWSIMMQDLPSNIPFLVGSRTTGVGDFVITWDEWDGPLPTKSHLVVKSSSNIGFLAVRTEVRGEEDLPTVNALQDQLEVVPLSEYCRTEKCKCTKVNPNTGQTTGSSCNIQPKASTAQGYCANYPENLAAQFPAENPLSYWEALNVVTTLDSPPAWETGLMRMYAESYLGPNQPFTLRGNTDVPPAILEGLENCMALETTASNLSVLAANSGENENNWIILPSGGQYGDFDTGIDYDYFDRATLNEIGPAGLPQQEAKYGNAVIDEQGELLSGEHEYTITLNPPPPVSEFWSVTAYTEEQFLYDNGEDGDLSNDIYLVNSRTGVQEPDGSYVINLSHSPTGEPPAGVDNWIPVPAGVFYLHFRQYGLQDPDYTLPPVVKQ